MVRFLYEYSLASQGQNQKAMDIAATMLKAGKSDKETSELTGLSLSEVQSVRKGLKPL